jgi:outer membrane protein assembly factor BamB
VYIPTQEAYFAWVHDPNYVQSDTGYNLGIDLSGGTYYQTHPNAPRGFVSSLRAWDPVTGAQVWQGESNAGPTGGALATAGGLVFHGGGNSQEFRAHDAATGAELWSTQARTGVFAGPISYEVDGRQYVAVTVGSGAQSPSAPNLSRLLVFALNGNMQLPP